MRSQRLSSLLLLLVALTSCTRSPADQLKTELQTIISWAATAQMAGEAWLKGNVPHAYAAQTLRTAEESLQEELKTIEEQPSEASPAQGSSTLQASLAARGRGLVQLIDRMRAAIESRDESTVAQLLKQLEREEQAVKMMSAGGGVQP
jgi:hypothetical protein